MLGDVSCLDIHHRQAFSNGVGVTAITQQQRDCFSGLGQETKQVPVTQQQAHLPSSFILGVVVALPLELSDLGDHKSKLHLLLKCKIFTLGFSRQSKVYRERAQGKLRQLLLQNCNFAKMKLGWMLSVIRRCHSDAALALQNRRTYRFSSAKMYGATSCTASSPVCKLKCTFKIKAFSFKQYLEHSVYVW